MFSLEVFNIKPPSLPFRLITQPCSCKMLSSFLTITGLILMLPAIHSEFIHSPIFVAKIVKICMIVANLVLFILVTKLLLILIVTICITIKLENFFSMLILGSGYVRTVVMRSMIIGVVIILVLSG